MEFRERLAAREVFSKTACEKKPSAAEPTCAVVGSGLPSGPDTLEQSPRANTLSSC
jgi:hypothetical protein